MLFLKAVGLAIVAGVTLSVFAAFERFFLNLTEKWVGPNGALAVFSLLVLTSIFYFALRVNSEPESSR